MYKDYYNQVYYGQSNSGGYYPESATSRVKTPVADPEHEKKYPAAPMATRKSGSNIGHFPLREVNETPQRQAAIEMSEPPEIPEGTIVLASTTQPPSSPAPVTETPVPTSV